MTRNDFKQPVVKSSINAEEFGFSANGKDNANALQKAIDHCKNKKIDRLVIAPGIYPITITEPLRLYGMENFEFFAEGVRFVVYSPITPKETILYFEIKDSSCIKFTGLEIDWDWGKARLTSLLKVVTRADTYVDFEFMEEGEIPENAVFISTNAYNDETFTAGVEGGREFCVNGNTNETFIRREKIGEKLYRCYADIKSLSDLFFQPGTYHLVRHFMYNGGAFSVKDTSHFTLENVTIYSIPGFGVHCGGFSHHLLFYKFRIVLPDFAKRYMTATVDGIHIANSKGYMLFEECDLGYQGDDCINIHDNVAMFITITSKNTFRFKKLRIFDCNEGDLLEFRNGDLSPTGFSATILKKEVTEEGLNITLDKEIPGTIKEDSVIFDRSFCSDHYEIRNCYFHETRARGILAQANHGIIENCRFYRMQGAAIQIETGASPTWCEGMGVDDLIIRNNEIIECDINDWDKAVLYMSTFLPAGIPIKNTKFPNPTTTVGDSGADFRTAYPMFTNIVIENNLFKEYPRRAIILTSYDGVTLKNNFFKNEISRKYNNPERGSIWSAYGSNLHLENNIFEPSPYMLMPEIIEE